MRVQMRRQEIASWTLWRQWRRTRRFSFVMVIVWFSASLVPKALGSDISLFREDRCCGGLTGR